LPSRLEHAKPKGSPDLYWLEKEAAEAFWLAYKVLLDDGKLDQVAQVSLSAAEALGCMAERLLLTEAAQFAGVWAPLFLREAGKTKVDGAMSEPEQHDLLKRLVLSNATRSESSTCYCRSPTASPTKKGKTATLSVRTSRVVRGPKIRTECPAAVIVELEAIERLVRFEREAEGRVLTPTWYLRQRIAFAYCRWYRESIEGLLGQFESAFGSDLEALVRETLWLAAAQVANRALEGCNKFRHHLERLHAGFEPWLEWRGHTEGEWPTVDWDAVSERVAKLQQRVEVVMAGLLVPLFAVPKSDTLPDYFGHALGTSTQACFEAWFLSATSSLRIRFRHCFWPVWRRLTGQERN